MAVYRLVHCGSGEALVDSPDLAEIGHAYITYDSVRVWVEKGGDEWLAYQRSASGHTSRLRFALLLPEDYPTEEDALRGLYVAACELAAADPAFSLVTLVWAAWQAGGLLAKGESPDEAVVGLAAARPGSYLLAGDWLQFVDGIVARCPSVSVGGPAGGRTPIYLWRPGLQFPDASVVVTLADTRIDTDPDDIWQFDEDGVLVSSPAV
ncbi:MAG: hypothetical protein IT175_12175 [Acidobacteria bacterium]|nr:hypothetical protein [Acidobacteriota bacterium]